MKVVQNLQSERFGTFPAYLEQALYFLLFKLFLFFHYLAECYGKDS
jgi:hypothetical protein